MSRLRQARGFLAVTTENMKCFTGGGLVNLVSMEWGDLVSPRGVAREGENVYVPHTYTHEYSRNKQKRNVCLVVVVAVNS